MKVQIVNEIAVVSAKKEEIPWYVAYANVRELVFNCWNGLIDHTDPTRVEMKPGEKYVGFQFFRRPTCTFSIDGNETTLVGPAIESSPEYFLDSELMEYEYFLDFARKSLETEKFIRLKEHMEEREASTWKAVLVFWWINREGERVWKPIQFKDDMVALNNNRLPVTTIKTFKGDRAL
ncbi:hypothetical protein HYV70_04395 [Candidatus Uhrbacteria bacterium]|nr:hypothetical protein [Candidatus Uhrbacteria bacterium]